MTKIIKYSIALIIFSIIISLFVFYFYLLKGITVENIDFQNINIGKLYIKIDKKIILKSKNIYINNKNNKVSQKKENINFKKTLNLVKKGINYLAYFQEIQIKNLNINENKISLISLKNNNLILDNNQIYLSSSFHYDKKNFYIFTDKLFLKQLNLNLNKIYTKLYATNNKLYIYIDTNYNYSKINMKITLTNNSIYYKGHILNVTKKTLEKFKQYLKDMDNLSIYSINFNGNKEEINTIINNLKATIKNFNITSPKLSLKFNISKNKLIAKTNNIDINYQQNKINIFDTKIYFDTNKTKAIIENEKTIIDINKSKITLLDNTIKYTPSLSTLNSNDVNINYQNFKGYIKDLELAYTDKNSFIYTDVINLESPELKGKIYNNNINYNSTTNNILITNEKTKINYQNYLIFSKNIESNYNLKNQLLNTKINYINIKNKELQASIYNSYIDFNKTDNNAYITNQKVLINYKTIKNIKLSKIKTSYIKKTLDTSIPLIKIDNIQIKQTKVNLKNDILTVLFDTNTLLSKKLNKILSVFGVNISIYQKTGKNKIKAKLTYNLKKDKFNTDLNISVDKSRLMLTDSTYLDIHHSNLNLIDSNIYLKNTTLDYNKSIVNLTYHINEGLIDLNKFYIKTKGRLNDLNITDIVEIKNYPENLYVDLNKIDIQLKNLKADVLIDDNVTVTIDKLSKLYPYMSYLQQYNINEGKVKIDIGDIIAIKSDITDTNQTILAKKLKYLKKLKLNTIIDDKNFTIFNKNIDIKLFIDKNLTIVNGNYNDLDINITQFVDKNSTEESNTTTYANIESNNTNIIYNNLKLYSSKLSIDYNTTDAKVSSFYKDRNITVFYNQNGLLKLYGLNIGEKTFKDLTNTNILNEPLLNIFVLRNPHSEIINGFIEIKKGYIKELKAFTNTLAFINLIPSLVTFQPAGFSSKGYKIKHGYIDFILYNNILYIKDINIKGENLTFDGAGYIDLNKKTINLNVNINLIVKLIKDIPIVNYILLGEDGGITLNLSITGDLNDPTISKNAISNILGGPLGIIKRLLLTPFRPFMKDDNE